MRDTLSIAKNEELGGASRVMRYTRAAQDGGEEYLFTIVLDDVRLPGTKSFQTVPQRLDLESTRALNEGEEPVLQDGDPRIGTMPMVFSIVSPSVGIFEAAADGKPVTPLQHDTLLTLREVNNANHSHNSYQHGITELVTSADPSTYTLITVTITTTVRDVQNPNLRIECFRDSLAHTLMDATQKLAYATLYRHAADAQPKVLPQISEGEDGHGEWLICALIGGGSYMRADGQYDGEVKGGTLESVEEWKKGLVEEGAFKGMDLKIGVWKGDIFVS